MKRLVFLGLLLTVLSGLLSCRNEGERVHVRIQNNSSKEIAYFWLGAGGIEHNHSYGDIAVGETTGYRSLKPIYATYGKFNFTTANNKRYRWSVPPEEDITELEPGYYTFVITIVNDTAVLQIINEPSPTR